ncbi:RHS repeat-associated core domain-containing protein [Chryseobacterium scophthalmum]|uniref:RHS repeat-associated core domain-containing protein n=1 Tax=Chryseobacterium scophthalmum TaxID=59733 RepID=UPI003CFCE949
MAEKKLPGKGWEYVVYDKQSRPVLTQDANLRTTTNNFAKRGWMFTKYDAFGRVLYTGFFESTGTRVAMQTAVNNISANALNNETITTTPFTQGSMTIYYTKNAFPTGSMTVLSVNYYDEYPTGAPAQPNLVQNQTTMKSAPTAFAANGFSSVRSTKTMPTGSYTRNIENDSWSSAFIWYDTMGRVVGTYGKNHLGGFTSTESSLDFSGKVKESYTYHSRNTASAQVTIKDRYVYSPYQFLQKHYQQINGQPEELISDLTYNDLGQITNKKVGGGLQSIDYTYNVRGWLLGINPNDLGTLGNKLFAYKIKYNQREGIETPNNEYTDLKVKPRYNGGIAEVDWKVATDNIQRRYGYSYDGINRLKAGFYQTDANPYLKEYNEILDYDLNGNISTLKRTASSDNSFTGTAQIIDNLTYTYDAGNRLINVTDASQNYNGYPGSSGTLIDYDDNGNMTSQKDKGINSISYNYLNLPEEIKFSATYIIRNKVTGEDEIRNVRTNYVYRADGTKLRKEYTAFFKGGSERTTTTDYLDGFQYTVNHLGTVTLEFVATPEGYYDFKNNRYIYNYADHLGNTRLSYFKNAGGSAEVLEENNYYPFGLKHEGYNALAGNPSYQYQYNGKELQEETGWNDYGARMYMSDIARWGVMDPLAEQYRAWSPYNYAVNNPVSFIDPDGRMSRDFLEQINNSPGGTIWTNNGGGFTNNWGGMMGYDGFAQNYKAYNRRQDSFTSFDASGGGNPTFKFPEGQEAYYQKNYPAFFDFVKNQLPEMVKDTNFMKALSSASGFSMEELTESFKYNQGMYLKALELPFGNAEYLYGGLTEGGTRNTAAIDIPALNWFEKANRNPKSVEGLTNLMYMSALVAHETGHWGDDIKRTVKYDNTGLSSKYGDVGDFFEHKAFGGKIGSYRNGISASIKNYVQANFILLQSIFK